MEDAASTHGNRRPLWWSWLKLLSTVHGPRCVWPPPPPPLEKICDECFHYWVFSMSRQLLTPLSVRGPTSPTRWRPCIFNGDILMEGWLQPAMKRCESIGNMTRVPPPPQQSSSIWKWGTNSSPSLPIPLLVCRIGLSVAFCLSKYRKSHFYCFSIPARYPVHSTNALLFSRYFFLLSVFFSLLNVFVPLSLSLSLSLFPIIRSVINKSVEFVVWNVSTVCSIIGFTSAL